MLDVDHSGKLGLEEFKTLLNDIAKWKVSAVGMKRVSASLRLECIENSLGKLKNGYGL